MPLCKQLSYIISLRNYEDFWAIAAIFVSGIPLWLGSEDPCGHDSTLPLALRACEPSSAAMATLNRRTALTLLGASLLPATAGAQSAPLDRLRGGGLVILMRHAQTTPGTGDPPGFRLDDCATQRNLSEAGIAQARAIGAALRAERVGVGRVLSSRWCRCLDTARLLDLGTVEPFEPLNSFFGEGDAGGAQGAAVREFVRGWQGAGNAVMVTHQVNITALTDVFPASGEAVVVTGAMEQVGRLRLG